MRRPMRRLHHLAVRLVVASATLALAACGGPGADQAQVEEALVAVSSWLQVDDDGGDTDEVVRRADRVLEATAPVVASRPDIEGFDPDEQAEFHDALAGLRESVAAQREVLAACEDPDPGTCLAASDLDPRDLADAVTRFQDALVPLDRPRAAGR